MDTPASAQTAMLAAQNKALPTMPKGTMSASKLASVSKEYESVFISQFLGSMFSGISTDGPFGGGEGEEMFRSMMVNEYSKSIEARGGFGLASAVTRQLLKHQETAQPQASVQ